MNFFSTTTKFFLFSSLLGSAVASQSQGINSASLDPSFDDDGRHTHQIEQSGSSLALGVAIQSDGKIVSAGTSDTNFAVARYNTNGNLDSSFGNGGKVITGMGGAEYGRALAIQSNGKIVVVGNKSGDFAVARYNINGSLDTSFENDGTAVIGLGGSEYATSVAIQSDGKIVIAGVIDSDAIVIRLTANGFLDTTFGVGGKVHVNRGDIESFSSVAIQSDGRLVVAGTLEIAQPSSSGILLMRFNSNGSVDTNFGSSGDGAVTFGNGSRFNYRIPVDISATGMAIQSNGSIVVCGNTSGNFAAARFFSNGNMDSGFGGSYGYIGSPSNFGGGISLPASNSPDTLINGYCSSIAVDSRGFYVLAGYFQTSNGYNFRIARYALSNGRTDSNFNSGNPYVDTSFGRQAEGAFGVAVQPDGKIVAAGQSGDRFAISRYYGSSITTGTINKGVSGGAS